MAPLAGRTVLLVEDNFLIGLEMAAHLRELGLDVIGPCATEAKARELVEQATPYFAVLDVHLRNGTSMRLAAELAHRGVRCMFVTGYSVIPELPDTLSHVPRLGKPIDPRALESALDRL